MLLRRSRGDGVYSENQMVWALCFYSSCSTPKIKRCKSCFVVFSRHFTRARRSFWIYLLWHSDAIWWQRSLSTLAQVITCCPSHYLNQSRLIINGVGRHSPVYKFTRDISTIDRYTANNLFKFLSKSARDNELILSDQRKRIRYHSKKKPSTLLSAMYEDGMPWKLVPCYWSFVRRIRRVPVDSPHKGLATWIWCFLLCYCKETLE